MRNRLILWALMAMVSTPMLAHADGYNGYNWRGWRLSTNEGFNLESGPSNVRDDKVAFPMTQLLDSDPNTAWVWDDTAWSKLNKIQGFEDRYKFRSFNITSEKSVVADELWLMNGYNKRKDLFQRNDRVIEIRIHLYSHASRNANPTVKTVALSDKMGWHKISIPRVAWKRIQIELTKIRKGSGKDNDICLSELALYSKGKKVDFKMPRAVIYQLSACCSGTGWLINRGGRVLAEAGTGEGASIEWSSDGKRVAGIDGAWNEKTQKSRNQIWIANVTRPAVIRRVPISHEYPGIKWLSNRTLQVSIQVETKTRVTFKEVRRIHSPS